MANQVIREFVIRVNSKGQVEAIRDYQKLDTTLNKTEKSAGAANRELKATAGAAKNATSSFAKQAQGLGGLVHVYATVAANVFALGAAFNVLKRNADLAILRTSSEQLSVATGKNFANVADSIKKVTGGAITFRDAMQSANLALSGGFTGTQASQIAEIATKAANALGRSVPEAVQRLTQAIVKGEPELADEFGIILRITEATNDYAKAIGKLPTELTTAQKSQAVFNQFLTQGVEKFNEVEIQTNPYDKLAASFSEIANKVLDFIRLPVDGFIKLIADNVLILSAIFAAIATKITTLAIPAVQKLTVTMAANAAAYSTKSQEQYILAQERVTNANLASAESFEDYKKLLSSGIKDIPFADKKKTTKFDPEYLVGENLDDDITRYLQKAFKNSDKEILKFRDSILEKLQGVKIGSIIDIDGMKVSTTQARALAEALELSTVSGAKAAETAFQNEIGTVNRLGLSFDVAKAKAASFAAQMKAAVAGQFSVGLTGGFFDNLKELPTLFNDNVKAAKGFGGKFAGAIGVGSRALGTLVGGATKLLGALGPIGIAVSFAVTAFSAFSDAIGLTSEELSKAEKAIAEMKDTTGLLQGQVAKLKTIGVDTFSALAKSAQFALNIIRNFEDDLVKVDQAFLSIARDLDQSLFSRIFGNEEEVFEVLDQLNTKIKVLGGSLGDAGQAFVGAAKAQTIDLAEVLKVDDDKFGKDTSSQIVKTLRKQLGSSEFLKQEGDKFILSFGAAFENEKARKAISEILNDFLELSDIAANSLSLRIGEGLKTGLEKPKELNESVNAAAEAVEELNDGFSKTTVKLQNSNPLYVQAVKLNRELGNVFKENGKLVTSSVDNVDPEVLRTFENALGSQITSLGDLAAASRAFIAQQEEFDSGIQNSKTSILAYEVALSNLSEQVRKGDVSAITTQFETQRNIGTERIKQLKIEKSQLEQQLIPLEGAEEFTSKRLEVLALIAQKEQQILKTAADVNIKYSEQQANIKVSLETAKSLLSIEKTRLSIIQDQSSVLAAVASASDDLGAKQKLLDFEKQITAQKIRQIDADIVSKKAALADSAGPAAAAIQEEIKLLQQRKDIERELSVIKQTSGQRDINLQGIELENKLARQLVDTRAVGLEIEKGLAEVRSDNNFLSTQQRDASRLLAIQKDVQLVESQRALIGANIVTTQAKIAEEVASISKLRAAGFSVAENTKRVQELQIDLIKQENEQRTLIVEKEERILELKEEQFEIDKKNANLFRDPEQFQSLLGEQFRRAAEEFGEAMGSSINRIVDITLGTIDAGIDAFVDAVRNGEDVLTATKDALKNTFLDLNTNLIKDVFKKNIRDLLGGIPGFKNIGKSEELQEAEKQTSIQRQMLAQMQKGNIPGAGTGVGSGTPQQTMFDNISTFFKDTFAKVKDFFTDIGTNISDIASKAINGVSDFIRELDLGGIFDSIAGFFSSSTGSFSAGSGGGTDIAGLAQTAISLFLAKGGITGQLQNRIPMYANGTVTSGPELAMIGEGPKREAVVPLPDNRSIPVTIFGEQEKAQVIENKINVNISGVQGTEEGLRRSANQIALEIARSQARAQGRIG